MRVARALTSASVLAVDLGGTNLRAGLLPAGADFADVEHLATVPAPSDLDGFRGTLQVLLREAAERAPVDRLGLAVPGTADIDRCLWVPKLPYLNGLSLEDLVEVPATVANDAQLALLAEVTAGSAAGRRDVVLFAVGTGIGSAVMTGGRIVVGAHGAACSAGWLSLDPDEPGHPTDGWLERHAAGPAFDAAAQRLAWLDGSDASSLMEAAAAGDPKAREAVAGPARMLGAAIAATVAVLDPECVLFAGGVAASFPALEPHLRDVLRRHAPAHLQGIELQVGRFGPRAGLVGAAVAGDRGRSWMEVQP